MCVCLCVCVCVCVCVSVLGGVRVCVLFLHACVFSNDCFTISGSIFMAVDV